MAWRREGTQSMVKMVEMDEVVTLQQQLGQEASPVILINKFNVHPADVEAFLQAWAQDAAFFKRQPGFISTQLHRGIGGSCVFINYAVWESVAHFRQALSQPEFQEALTHYPPSAVGSPHLFEKVAVSNICVA
jgi:quinol monooxygenase YgiN